MSDIAPTMRICRGCGCDDLHACQPFGCCWVLLDIHKPAGVCSACADEMEWDPVTMALAICPDAAEAFARWGVAA